MDNRPIGLLDSGLGGLTVLKELKKILPNESTVYIGDEKRMPYGSRTTEEIILFTKQMIDFLISKNAKLIIFACNTATANALDILQPNYSIPFIGVIPGGAEDAVSQTKNKNIAVIATEATIRAHAYPKYIGKLNPSIETLGLAAPDLVPVIENQKATDEDISKVIDEDLHSLKEKNFDTLILGCTHYPIIKKQIIDYLPETVTVIDPAINTSRMAAEHLIKLEMTNGSQDKVSDQIYTTADPQKFTNFVEMWLENKESINVEKVSIEE